MAKTPRDLAKGKRGFASMDPAKQRELASKGGKSVPQEKRTFSRLREIAVAAGRKGGLNSRRSASKDAD
jgi:general stress protein YciG